MSLPVTWLLRLLAPLLAGGDPSRAAVAERAVDDLDPSGRWAGLTRRANADATADEALTFARALHRGQPVSAEHAADTLRQLVADSLRYDLGPRALKSRG